MTKTFGDFIALDDVSLTLEPGSFHALLGENGAGKSTLVKCLMGYYRADHGHILVNGHEHAIASPRDAHGAGIGMVYQHFTLVPSMTVAENLVLARPNLPTKIDWAEEVQKIEAFMGRVPFKVDVHARVQSLAAGQKQKVEIIKQLYLGSRVLLLDEPTSVLTPQEADEVLGLLRRSADAGEISVLMITHKLREIFSYAKTATVLRRGKVTGGGMVSDLSAAHLTELMVGRSTLAGSVQRAPAAPGHVRLELVNLQATDERGVAAINGVTLAIRSGEIVGIAGVSGNGQRELVEVLAGQRRKESGEIRIRGKAYHASRAELLREHVACVPEEPLRNACVGAMSVADNLAFRYFDNPNCQRAGVFTDRGKLTERAVELIGRFNIKTSSPQAPVQSLSGGNVQRLVLARELSDDVDVLIISNPCFGLDVAATSDIHEKILLTRNQGAAVLLVSEDLDEILELADVVVVLFGGNIVLEAPVMQVDRNVIGRSMAGHVT
ncbi:MAG: ABC transporter ATP-binding protein [Parvibaculaceae bacterium]